MKDIDFDELDKAVTSLMGAVPKSEPTKSDDDIKTLVLNPSQSAEPLPVPASASVAEPVLATPPTSPQPATPAPAVPAATPAPSPSLATRRAGRFMDVVHPSSDMTKPGMAVSRHGGTIEPPSSMTSTDIEPAEEPVDIAVPPSPIGAEPVLTTDHTPSSIKPDVPAHALSDWPDPLDMPHTQVAPDETREDDTAPVMSAPTTPIVDPMPLSSPFLPDAKVEKRPLGGGSPESQPSVDEPAEIAAPETPADEPAPEPVATSAPENAPLPEELQSDLMAIESRQADTETEPAPAAPVVQHAPTSAKLSPASASIAQQYKESPSTGDQSNGAIYDTDTYHQPLQHPAKKKPGWIWVVWVLVLLVIGAGGGAAAYLYLLK